MEFRVLGPVEVLDGGRHEDPHHRDSGRSRALAACSRLLRERLDPEVRDRLIEGSRIRVDEAIDEQLARS